MNSSDRARRFEIIQKSLSSGSRRGRWAHKPVRGLYMAMGQYSSFCEGAVVISLGGDDIEDGVLGRVQVE